MFSHLPFKKAPRPICPGWSYFIVAECKMRQRGCSCVNTPLTVVTIQALLNTAHKQRWTAKDAYRGSKCSRSKAQVLVEEAAAQSGESRALCWFITLLGLVTEIRTSMFQSDSWPLRFTHRGARHAHSGRRFSNTHARLHTGGEQANAGKITPTPTHACARKSWKELIGVETDASSDTSKHAHAH